MSSEILEIGQLVQEGGAPAPQIMNPERYREFQICEKAIKEESAVRIAGSVIQQRCTPLC